MARISTYGLDTLDKNDKLLGSDQGGATKNFSVDEISSFFKNTNAGGASGQFNFQYLKTGLFNSAKGTITLGSESDTINFSSVTTAKVSIYTTNDTVNTITNYLQNEFVNKRIIIADTLVPNNYGVYRVEAVAVDSGDSNFYDLTLSARSGNGALVSEQFYSIILFAGAQDAHFEFHQASASSTWNVTHNLGKFPSVIVKLADGTIGQAAVTHNNINNLTITFGADTSGTAYMN